MFRVAGAGLGLALPSLIEACTLSTATPGESVDGRLNARPPASPRGGARPGLTQLGLSSRDAQLYVPASYDGTSALPLLVLLHGAGRDASEWTSPDVIRTTLDEKGIAMLAPASRGATWSPYGADVSFIDQALRTTFDLLRVDSARIGIGGFSDGASFGMSLGIANGDFFPRVLGYSAGYLVPFQPAGHPRVFMSHGTADPILPYSGGVAIADALRKSGYSVDFTTHDGGHTIGPVVLRKSFDWFLG